MNSCSLRAFYFPTARIENEPGTIGGRARRPSAGGVAGAGPYWAAMSSTLPVLPPSVSVLAPGMVVTVCSKVKTVGVTSLMTVRVPSRCELKHSRVCGLKAAPSQP